MISDRVPFSVQNIVADMRKVLAKNPQVEQQRLHRRVFLDNINPENQALLVSVKHSFKMINDNLVYPILSSRLVMLFITIFLKIIRGLVIIGYCCQS